MINGFPGAQDLEQNIMNIITTIMTTITLIIEDHTIRGIVVQPS